MESIVIVRFKVQDSKQSVTFPSTSAQAPGTLSFPLIQLCIASAGWFQSIYGRV